VKFRARRFQGFGSRPASMGSRHRSKQRRISIIGHPLPRADRTIARTSAFRASGRALVDAKGYREYGLRCLLLACDRLYVRTRQLDAEHLRNFEQAQRLKMSPAEAVAATSAFVKRTLELLGQ
jgi:hypothetical protein